MSFLLVITLTLTSGTSAQQPTLEEARAGYAKTIDALFPIWTHCLWSKKPIAEEFKTGPFAMSPVVGTNVEWAIDGGKWHFSHHSDQNRRWISYDGKSVWELTFDKPNLDTILAGERYSLKTRSDFVPRIGPTPGKWLGVYFAINEEQQSGASLRQMLNSPGALLLGEGTVDEHPALRIEVGFPTPAGDELPVSVWLDSSVGFLPRRIETRFSGADAPPDVLLVEAFREITTERGTRTWFPDRMTQTTALAASELQLVEIMAGAKPAQQLFRPKLPAGAPVFDMENVDGLRAHARYVRGDAGDPRSETRATPRRAPTPLPSEIVPITPAHPESGYSWPQILMFLGLITLAGASWQLFQKKI